MNYIFSVALEFVMLITLILIYAMYSKLEKRIDELERKCIDYTANVAHTINLAQDFVSVKENLYTRVQNLENGTVPDFEKAKEAANALNDFNAGITNMLGFNPVMALRKENEK